jgi:hypothetical protein
MQPIPTTQAERKPEGNENSKLCEQCRKQFEPRSGSGGKPQRFCSTDCRLAFHSEAQRGQRSPTCSASAQLPAVIDPPAPKPPADAPEASSDFDWNDDDSIVLHEQPAIAVYINQSGGLTIRQERSWNQADAIIIAIAPENVGTFIDKLTDIIGIPSAGKP